MPGGYYHVIGRGIERRAIFSNDVDKEDFLSRLDRNLARSQTKCLAWALMPNHYHLLIRVGDSPLAKLMAGLLGGYASSYNRRNDRVGYVFQNRFKSILCDADNYLHQLVRYIHLNPLRAGLIENLRALDHYRWTGHAGVLGKNPRCWHETESVLRIFGTTKKSARKNYLDFLTISSESSDEVHCNGGGLVRSYGGWENVCRLRQEHVRCIGDEQILGASHFVDEILAQDELSLENRTHLELQGWTLEKLMLRVCNQYDVTPESLSRQTRNNSHSTAKSLICFWGMSSLGLGAR